MTNGFTILLVEDDAGDRELFRHALGRAGGRAQVCEAHDGEQACEYLAGRGRFADRVRFPMPDLVLLDLQLPRRSGFEVLQWARSQPHLKQLPILVLTSSSESKDIDRAYSLGANSYLVKTIDMDALSQMVKGIAEYAALVARDRSR